MLKSKILKTCQFDWDGNKEYMVIQRNGYGKVELKKWQCISLMRFCLSVLTKKIK